MFKHKKKSKPKKIQPEYDIVTYLGSKCRVCHFGNNCASIELENSTKIRMFPVKNLLATTDELANSCNKYMLEHNNNSIERGSIHNLSSVWLQPALSVNWSEADLPDSEEHMVIRSMNEYTEAEYNPEVPRNRHRRASVERDVIIEQDSYEQWRRVN